MIENVYMKFEAEYTISGFKDHLSQADEKVWSLKLEMCNIDYSTNTVINI